MPGSRKDVVRTKSLSGPSPVGGAFGGTESLSTLKLDEFELQAAHYNIACAHARLGNLDDVRALIFGCINFFGLFTRWYFPSDSDGAINQQFD